MQQDSYKTIAALSEGFFKDKASKFFSYAYPVESEEECKKILVELKKKYHSARHHCYSYRIGVTDELHRLNDDGEPSGTAGRPIYGQIVSYELTNILIVVVRYFGGILLGTSGLINAYKLAATDSLKNAKIIEKTITDTIELSFDYKYTNDIIRLLNMYNSTILSQRFEEMCYFKIQIRKSLTGQFTGKIKTYGDIGFILQQNETQA